MTTASNIDEDIGTYRRRCHRSEKARDALLAITVPGASASATATAAAIGRGVNFGNMLEAPSEGAWGLTVTDDFAAALDVRFVMMWEQLATRMIR
jgi:hypothetical protein